MKILVVVGPALGILNHTIALSNLLVKKGGHEIVWLTGLKSQNHLSEMNFNSRVYFSDSHDINFDKNDASRKPHLMQVCDKEYLKKAIEFESKVIEKEKPNLIITKHHYSVPISSRLHQKPFATYYTDGGEYLMPNRNPQSFYAEESLSLEYNEVAEFFKLILEKKPINDYLKSPFLNIIRGIPFLSSLTREEISNFDSSCVFGGLLTYDGPEQFMNFPIIPPWIYVTFGTISQDKRRIQIVIDALKEIDMPVLISTMNIDPQEFETPSHIYLTKYVPNFQALSSSSLVIHHGGHGTLLSSFERGVPQIIIPDNVQSSAQGVHARTLVNKKCGLYIDKEILTIETLRNAVNQILSDPRYIRNAKSLTLEIDKQNAACNADLLEKILTQN